MRAVRSAGASIAIASSSLLLVGAPAAQPTKQAPPQGVCLKVKDNPVLVEVVRGKLKYCFDQGKSLACYSTDLVDGSLWATAAPAHNGEGYPSVPKGADEPGVETTETEIKICAPHTTECKSFKPKNAVDPGLGLTVAANATGTLAALTNSEWVETFDVKKGKRIARFKAGKGKYACSFVDFVGDGIVVDHFDCGDMKQSDTWIGTTAGKRLSVVGGKKPIGMTTNPVQIEGTKWAFASRTGDKIAIHDVKNGKLVEQISIGEAVDDVMPVLAYGVDSDDNTKLALVYSESRVGDVVIVDLATKQVSSYPAKRCTK